MKAQIFTHNAARIFKLNIAAKRNEVPKDYLSKIKMAYHEEGSAPSNRFYAWVTT